MILNRDPNDKEPKRLVFENCTFIRTAEGKPVVPDFFLQWWCSCEHASQLEHDAAIGKSTAFP